MVVKVVTLVVKGSAQLTIPSVRQVLIQVGSRGVALRRVFDQVQLDTSDPDNSQNLLTQVEEEVLSVAVFFISSWVL